MKIFLVFFSLLIIPTRKIVELKSAISRTALTTPVSSGCGGSAPYFILLTSGNGLILQKDESMCVYVNDMNSLLI